jgi:succinate dehydrogenase / fumarate reductase cytochrome b subunit
VRISGNALLFGAILVVWWLLAASTDADYFEFVDGLMTSVLGDLVMLGSLWALWYHALGGLRHLIWDTGRGLDIETADKMGWGMIIGSVALTFLTVIAI